MTLATKVLLAMLFAGALGAAIGAVLATRADMASRR